MSEIFIDQHPVNLSIIGDFKLGNKSENIEMDSNFPYILKETGYCSCNLIDSDELELLRDGVNNLIKGFLGKSYKGKIGTDLLNYHRFVTDNEHNAVINKLRKLSYEEISKFFNLNKIRDKVESKLGCKLDYYVPKIERTHIQIRVNRPNSFDYNPPHRDSYVDVWKNSINVWLPVVGCNEYTSLPIVKGSHMYDDSEILRTDIQSASINNNKYNVPAIAEYKGNKLYMERVCRSDLESIIFTPYLIHGGAVNPSNSTRVSIELRLEIINE